jgi:hypothetical protein
MAYKKVMKFLVTSFYYLLLTFSNKLGTHNKIICILLDVKNNPIEFDLNEMQYLP